MDIEAAVGRVVWVKGQTKQFLFSSAREAGQCQEILREHVAVCPIKNFNGASLFQDKQAIGIPTGSSQEYWRVKGTGDGLEL